MVSRRSSVHFLMVPVSEHRIGFGQVVAADYRVQSVVQVGAQFGGQPADEVPELLLLAVEMGVDDGVALVGEGHPLDPRHLR